MSISYFPKGFFIHTSETIRKVLFDDMKSISKATRSNEDGTYTVVVIERDNHEFQFIVSEDSDIFSTLKMKWFEYSVNGSINRV